VLFILHLSLPVVCPSNFRRPVSFFVRDHVSRWGSTKLAESKFSFFQPPDRIFPSLSVCFSISACEQVHRPVHVSAHCSGLRFGFVPRYQEHTARTHSRGAVLGLVFGVALCSCFVSFAQDLHFCCELSDLVSSFAACDFQLPSQSCAFVVWSLPPLIAKPGSKICSCV
jgi:hypothetical protein